MSYHQTDRGSQQYWYGIDLWMKRNVAQNVQDKFSVEKVNILPPRLQLEVFKTCVNLIFSECLGSHPNVD